MPAVPRVGVVVIHYGTDDLTMRCLHALVADDRSPATRIVVVDNGPGAGIAERARRDIPDIEVVVPGRNLGFAGGANAGIAALEGCELIALVNSDVLVEPGWLTPLVDSIDADPRRGAVSAKMLFEGTYQELRISTSTAWRPGRGDSRSLGWRLEGVLVGGNDVTSASQLVDGFWEPDDASSVGGVWAGPQSVLRVPAGGEGDPILLRVGTPPGVEVTLRCAGAEPEQIDVPAGGGWCELVPTGPRVRVVNNVGNAWRDDGYGVDLGFQEIDLGQHDVPAPVPAWCGGAVLLRRSYLDQSGTFDERLFLYYEDLELSRRGATSGWSYWYEPRAVVSHRHAASAAQDTRRSHRLKERNRLLVVARHDGGRALTREVVRYVAITLSYLRRDVVAPVLRGAAPRWAGVGVRVRALAGAVALMPAMWRSRREDRRRSSGMPPLA